MRRSHLVAIAALLMGAELGRPAPKKAEAPDGETFHGHLDKCSQCERNPFALCPIGAALIEREAGGAQT